MRYDYRCGTCNEVHEETHPMSSYPRETVCVCGGKSSIIITGVPLLTVDWTERGGYNDGAGEFFSNKQQRAEWMRKSERIEVDPMTGKEHVTRIREVYPEETMAEKRYLNECKQAKADGVAIPPHPDEIRRKEIVKQQVTERVQARRGAAVAELEKRGV